MALSFIFINSSLAMAEYGLSDIQDKVLVKRVLKADTIILDNDEKIHLIGLNAPDAPRLRREVDTDKTSHYEVQRDATNPITSIEEQAFDFARSLLEGKYVRLEFDEQRKNEDFVNLAYVFLVEDNTFANAEILRQGFANLQIRPPNTKYADALRAAYREAHQEKRGLHNEN